MREEVLWRRLVAARGNGRREGIDATEGGGADGIRAENRGGEKVIKAQAIFLSLSLPPPGIPDAPFGV